MILVLYAHPYPQHSRACKVLLGAVNGVPDLEVRSLYDLYPDFDIDVAAEQAALMRADLVVWLHPVYWYSVPSLMKHWFDVVLLQGWAFGPGGTALHGKHCLWVASAGGDETSYAAGGMHGRPFADFIAPIEQTARFCGMSWARPLVVYGAHLVADDMLQASAAELHTHLLAWAARKPPNNPEAS
jgi:glutathione-regulated potassium-efflux system ancillary protein KefF